MKWNGFWSGRHRRGPTPPPKKGRDDGEVRMKLALSFTIPTMPSSLFPRRGKMGLGRGQGGAGRGRAGRGRGDVEGGGGTGLGGRGGEGRKWGWGGGGRGGEGRRWGGTGPAPGGTRGREGHRTGRDKEPGGTRDRAGQGAGRDKGLGGMRDRAEQEGGEGGGGRGTGEGRWGRKRAQTVKTDAYNPGPPSIQARGLPRWTRLTVAMAHPDGRSRHLGGGQSGGGGDRDTDGCGTDARPNMGMRGRAPARRGVRRALFQHVRAHLCWPSADINPALHCTYCMSIPSSTRLFFCEGKYDEVGLQLLFPLEKHRYF